MVPAPPAPRDPAERAQHVRSIGIDAGHRPTATSAATAPSWCVPATPPATPAHRRARTCALVLPTLTTPEEGALPCSQVTGEARQSSAEAAALRLPPLGRIGAVGVRCEPLPTPTTCARHTRARTSPSAVPPIKSQVCLRRLVVHRTHHGRLMGSCTRRERPCAGERPCWPSLLVSCV